MFLIAERGMDGFIIYDNWTKTKPLKKLFYKNICINLNYKICDRGYPLINAQNDKRKFKLCQFKQKNLMYYSSFYYRHTLGKLALKSERCKHNT